MIDGFWSGVIGGTVVPIIAVYLGRFGYLLLFSLSALIAWLGLFVTGIYMVGLDKSIHAFFSGKQFGVIAFSVGLGAVVVFFVWINSIGREARKGVASDTSKTREKGRPKQKRREGN